MCDVKCSCHSKEPDYTEIRDEEIRSKICELMSEMLNNPDEHGIYPTSKFIWKMENYCLELRDGKKDEDQIVKEIQSKVFEIIQRSDLESSTLSDLKTLSFIGFGFFDFIKSQIEDYLSGLFKKGYFPGDTVEDSYFVILDHSNNKEENIDDGIVFCDVGLSLENPGEFRVFRFESRKDN